LNKNTAALFVLTNKSEIMKTIMIITALVLTSAYVNAQSTVKKTFHDFTVTTIDGNEFPLSQLKGKKVLVVNTASKCGYTPQYEDLEKLYETYGGDHFTVIGFPANNFMNQEPGTNEEIKQFCSSKYAVTFQMMSKISVKGSDIAPVYSWLTKKAENGIMDAPVKWNFQKFMIDENGNLIDMAPSSENPLSEKIVSWIKE
jgi:glutathione peroxidase